AGESACATMLGTGIRPDRVLPRAPGQAPAPLRSRLRNRAARVSKRAPACAPFHRNRGKEVTRIAFLVTGLDRGGAELQVVQLARALQQQDWDVAVFSLRPGPLAEDVRSAGIPVSTFAQAALLRFRPHILHAHLFHANLTARLTRLWVPIPV